MRKMLVLLSSCLMAAVACTGSRTTVEEPVSATKGPLVSKDGSKLTKAEAVEVVHEREGACYPLKVNQTPPFFLPKEQIVITRIAKNCETTDDKPGYERDTSWMAMGFPCTGGGGVIEFRDNFSNPKMVSFQIPNSCLLKPSSRDFVQQIGIDRLGLKAEAKLLAYYPLAIQYWELVDFPDADVGYGVDLRSPKSREDGWTKFRMKKAPIRVRLYGHENAWVKDNRLYQAEANIIYTGRESFALEVTAAKALTPEEMQTVKARCEAIRPMRNCNEVFF